VLITIVCHTPLHNLVQLPITVDGQEVLVVIVLFKLLHPHVLLKQVVPGSMEVVVMQFVLK
jgi:hypothetical protein